MANYGPANAWILVGGLNVTGDHYTMDRAEEQILDQTNALGDSWEEHTPVGVGRATLEMGAGLYDDRVAGQLAAYQEQGTTLKLVALGFSGYALGAPCELYNGTYANVWKRTMSKANLTMGNATHTISGPRVPGVVLHAISPVVTSAGDNEVSDTDAAALAKSIPIDSSATSDVFTFKQPHGLAVGDKVLFTANHTSTPDPDGNVYVVATVPSETTATFTGLDITVAGTGGSIQRVGIASAYADLHVDSVALGGYDNWIVTLRHSDDGITWSDAVAFTAVTAQTSERKAVANLKRYRAVSWALTGSGSSPSLGFLVGCQV